MHDLEERLRGADQVEAPNLWGTIEAGAGAPERHGGSQLVTIVLALGVSILSIGAVVLAFSGGDGSRGLPSNGVFAYADQGPQPPSIPFDNIDLFAFDAVTGERVNLTNTPTVAESAPIWSPDGSKVLYQRSTARRVGANLHVISDVVVAGADGSDPIVIRTCDDACSLYDVAWSPDNASLAWTMEKHVGAGFVVALEVFVIDGGTTIEICDSRMCGDPGQPAWSPDGDALAFSDAGSGRMPGPIPPSGPIWVADPATGAFEALTTTGEACVVGSEACVFDSAPVWSPDGTSIGFVRSTNPMGDAQGTSDVMLVTADGSNERRLSRCTSRDRCLSGPLAWSPAGDSIAFFERYGAAVLSLVDPSTGEVTPIPLPVDADADAASLQWSADGARIAFAGGPADGSDLYVLDPVTGDARIAADDIGWFSPIRWLPAGAIDISTASPPPVVSTTTTPEPTTPVPDGTIAFASSSGSTREDEGVEIWTVAPDGSRLTQITDNGFVDGQPAISPEGTRIAFISYRPGDRNTQIYLMDRDGTDQHALTDGRVGSTNPAWSPDGARITFTASAGYGEPGGVFVMDADGSDERLVAEGNAFDPSWSPDGSTIVYAVEPIEGGPLVLAAVDLATGIVTQPLVDLVGDQTRPAWSPDGQTIAFEWFTQSGNGLYVTDLGGSDPGRLGDGVDPSWSPDGTWLAYAYDDGRRGQQIWIVAADGAGARPVTSFPRSSGGVEVDTQDPSWSAAG